MRPACPRALEKATYPIVVPPLTRSQAVAQIGNVLTGQLGSSEEIDDVFDELHDRLVSDVGLSTTTTEWNPVARRFKEGLPDVLAVVSSQDSSVRRSFPPGLAAAQTTAATTETLSSHAQQEQAGMESSEPAGRLELAGSATGVNFDVASQLAQELRHTDDWLKYSGRARGSSKSRNDDPPGRRLSLIRERLNSTFRAVRGSVYDDPRLMDALLEETHQLVRRIQSVVKQELINADRSRSPSEDSEIEALESQFEAVRADESDMYELYANDLERYRRLQLKELDVVLKRRRAYISIFQVFQQRTSAIVEYLYALQSRRSHDDWV